MISGGRLIVGGGLGYRDVENAAFGLHPCQRVGRFVEPVRHQGRHFILRDIRISMPPSQRSTVVGTSWFRAYRS